MSRKSGYRFSEKDTRKRKKLGAGNLLQRGGERWAMARDGEPFDARTRAGHQRDIPRWDAGRIGQQGDQSVVRLAFGRGGPNPRLKHALPVGALLDALDGVASTSRRQPNDDQKPAGCG